MPIRLLVGLHFLKHAFGESDESMVERFVENPYWQYICGFEYFQHTFPLAPPSLVQWRMRIKPEGMEKLLQEAIATAEKIFRQKWDDGNKVYSVHAPEVECIGKGKAHKKYEFGCKVPVVTTSRGNWVVGIDALHGNPFDGLTLKRSIGPAERLTGWTVTDVFCDRGYKGAQHTLTGKAVNMTARKKEAIRRWLKRREAIEPIIGHLKSDNRRDRNHLRGKDGDRINAILAGCGFNLRTP